MKVIEKEVTENVLTGNELFELQQAIQTHLQTSESLKGYHVRLMLGNLERLDPILIPLVEKHSLIIEKYCKKDESGQVVKTPNGFEFESEDNAQKYAAESKALWESEIENVQLVSFPYSVFDEMVFNMAKNNKVYLLLKHLCK